MRTKAHKENASKTDAVSGSMSAARKNTISSPACSFRTSEEKGDNMKNFKKRKELRTKSCEHILGVAEH